MDLTIPNLFIAVFTGIALFCVTASLRWSPPTRESDDEPLKPRLPETESEREDREHRLRRDAEAESYTSTPASITG